jgi:hypothetical protein
MLSTYGCPDAIGPSQPRVPDLGMSCERRRERPKPDPAEAGPQDFDVGDPEFEVNLAQLVLKLNCGR